jgi:hypothetical protein
MPLPRVSLSEIRQPWGAAYRKLQEPFILTNAMHGWDTPRLTLDAVTQAFPRCALGPRTPTYLPQAPLSYDSSMHINPAASSTCSRPTTSTHTRADAAAPRTATARGRTCIRTTCARRRSSPSSCRCPRPGSRSCAPRAYGRAWTPPTLALTPCSTCRSASGAYVVGPLQGMEGIQPHVLHSFARGSGCLEHRPELASVCALYTFLAGRTCRRPWSCPSTSRTPRRGWRWVRRPLISLRAVPHNRLIGRSSNKLSPS